MDLDRRYLADFGRKTWRSSVIPELRARARERLPHWRRHSSEDGGFVGQSWMFRLVPRTPSLRGRKLPIGADAMNPDEKLPAVMSDEEARRIAEFLDRGPGPRDDSEVLAFAG